MKILVLVTLSLICGLVLADNKIETIQLNHRLAEEVLVEIQPFLPAEATARAANELIILKASPKVISEIKLLIDQLDTPAQSLTIKVLRTDEALSDNQRSQIDTDIDVNERNSAAAVTIRNWSTSNYRNGNQQYQARGIAGRPIMINTGKALPQKEQVLLLNSHGDLAVQTNTTYIDIYNGFQAIANILPNHQVSVEIYPQFASFSKQNGGIAKSEMYTNISGPLGTWLEIGQVSNDKNMASLGGTHYQTSHTQQHIYIKVDEIISQ